MADNKSKKTTITIEKTVSKILKGLCFNMNKRSKNEVIKELLNRYELNERFIMICIMFKHGHSNDLFFEELDKILESYDIDEESVYRHIEKVGFEE